MLKAYFLLFLISAAAPAVGADLKSHTESVYLNDSGLAQLQQKNFASAQKLFLKAMALDRTNISARMNLALTFELAGDSEKARKEFLAITKDPLFQNRPELFFAYFNLGKLLGDAKDIEGALQAYQKALSFRPDSIEVKTNIELLVQEGGGGGSGSQQKQDQSEQGDQQQDPQQDQNQNEPEKQKQESPQELSKNDIKKIFEELKNQEQKIRELEYGEGARKDSGGKDW